MTIETPRQDIASIQMLRGIAALMVVVVHVYTQLERMGHQGERPHWLDYGVDIFFVISGFIMWVSTERAPRRTASGFLVNRIIRIVPLYWALTLGMAVLMLVVPNIFQTAVFDLPHILKSLFFIPARHPAEAAAGAFWPVVVPGWTLNYEMFFYVLFAAAILLSRGSSVRRGWYIAFFIALAVALGQLFGSVSGEISFYGNPIIFEFLFGIGIGYLYVNRLYPCSPLWWGALVVGFALLPVLSWYDLPRLVSAGLPSTLILAAAAFAPPFAFAPLRWLGDTSYSLYLSHTVALSALAQTWRKLEIPTQPAVLVALVAISFSILIGWLTYILVEKPLTRAARRLLSRRSVSLPPGRPAPEAD